MDRKQLKGNCIARSIVVGMAVASPLAMAIAANVNEWMYDTSRRHVMQPSQLDTEEVTIDAMTRGIGNTLENVLDTWYRTFGYSEEAKVRGCPSNRFIISVK